MPVSQDDLDNMDKQAANAIRAVQEDMASFSDTLTRLRADLDVNTKNIAALAAMMEETPPDVIQRFNISANQMLLRSQDDLAVLERAIEFMDSL